MVLKLKAKKISQQVTIPENLDNMSTLRDTYIDIIYMGNRKRQDLLSRKHRDLGSGFKGRGEAGRGSEKNVELNKKR